MKTSLVVLMLGALASLAGCGSIEEPAAASEPAVVKAAASGYTYENIRTIVPKSVANSYCPAGSTAIYAPQSYLGNSGRDICGADAWGKTTCAAVRYVWVGPDNRYGTYPSFDRDCSSSLDAPWPWGWVKPGPATSDGDWGYGTTLVVCCR